MEEDDNDVTVAASEDNGRQKGGFEEPSRRTAMPMALT